MSMLGQAIVPFLIVPIALAAGASADQTPTALDYSPAVFRVEPPAEESAAAPAKRTHAAFGAKGSQWLTFGAGVADNFEDAVDTDITLAWSTFLANDIELSLEAAGWYFNQPGANTGGVSGSLVFRWHFVNTGKWTVYADAGIGLLGAFDDVPAGGTSLNFMPRAGMGFTRQLSEETDTRFQMGLQWHHISNARINGDEDNPSRDSAMLYAALIFPF